MKRRVMKSAALGMALLIGTTLSSTPILATDYDQHWAKEAITKWSAYEVIKGYENGEFRPNNLITRAEFATLLDRLFKFPEATTQSPYMDMVAAPNKWYVTPISKVTALDLMYIQGFLFEPNKPITREEAAYALVKAYELTPVTEGKTIFKDEDNISAWAKEAVTTLANYDYISGTPEGKFMPQGTLTRAEIVTMLNNMTSTLITSAQPFTQSVKGNIIINSSEAVLQNMTIEGDLYIAASVKKTVLDQVTVTGKVYIRGGSVALSGTYQEVQLATGAPIELLAGTIEKLVVTKAGSHLKVAQGAAIRELVAKAPIETEGKVPQLKSAQLQMSGQKVDLPVSGQTIEIDLLSLSKKYKASDTIDSFKILADSEDAVLSSSIGRIEMGGTYTFHQLEEQLGLIREIATEVGLPPKLIISQLLPGDQVTLGSLLENYALGKRLASSLGYTLKDSYSFERFLTSREGTSQTITITLRLQ